MVAVTRISKQRKLPGSVGAVRSGSEAHKSLKSQPGPVAGTRAFADAAPDFRFASSVAAFGMALRGSPHAGDATRESILGLAQGALADDPGGLRREFVGLMKKARLLERGR